MISKSYNFLSTYVFRLFMTKFIFKEHIQYKYTLNRDMSLLGYVFWLFHAIRIITKLWKKDIGFITVYNCKIFKLDIQ